MHYQQNILLKYYCSSMINVVFLEFLILIFWNKSFLAAYVEHRGRHPVDCLHYVLFFCFGILKFTFFYKCIFVFHRGNGNHIQVFKYIQGNT